ncbi:putative plant organelle RNA recognition domain-containing protein [Helianthus anomalus]
MKKGPDLEAALTRNLRWIINNQINIILRCPGHVSSVNFIQKKFKTLDLQGKALNWVKKYSCCFEVYLKDDEYHCRLTKKMIFLVQEEEAVKDMQETVFVERLAKVARILFDKNHTKHLDMFRVVNYDGRKNSMQIELIKWDPKLAISRIERKSQEQGCNPSFTCSLPSTWVKSWEKFHEYDSLPYISPYTDPGHLVNGSKESEKEQSGEGGNMLYILGRKTLEVVLELELARHLTVIPPHIQKGKLSTLGSDFKLLVS